jgi:hypothetical protein
MRVPRWHPFVYFMPQPTNRNLLDFEVQTRKLSTLVLRPKLPNRSYRFWGPNQETIDLVLRLNQETRAPHLLVHSTDHTRCQLTSRSSGYRVLDLYLTILSHLHQVSYSYLDPCRCPSCHSCYLHITRHANTILHMNKGKVKTTKIFWIWIQTSAYQWLITIKTRNWPLGFSISPLMSLLTTKGTKFEVWIQCLMKHR